MPPIGSIAPTTPDLRRVAIALLAALVLLACGSGSKSASDQEAEKDAGLDASTAGASGLIDGGGTLAEAPDGEASCPVGACNYQSQQGCGETESCHPEFDPNGELQPSCVSAGTAQEGQACTWESCDRGHFCFNGICRRLCCGGDWSVCPDDQACLISLSIRATAGSDPVSAFVGLCVPVDGCNPLDPCADAGNSCQLVDGRGNWSCVTSGEVEVGAACSSSDRCVAGALCVSGSCRRLCGTSSNSIRTECPEAEGQCVHFVRDPESVGECTPVGT